MRITRLPWKKGLFQYMDFKYNSQSLHRAETFPVYSGYSAAW